MSDSAQVLTGAISPADDRPTARAEWGRHFMLPIAGAVGYATGVLFLYGIGAYLGPIGEALGWSRVQTTFGLTIALAIGAVLAIPMGMLVDRYGPRRFGLVGVLLVSGAFALLSTTSGELKNWYGLWAVLGIVSLPAQSVVWTRAVASCFDRSRGMALAVTMCGASLATALFPILATWLIEAYGWRLAMAFHGAIWAAFSFPMVFFFVRPGSNGERAAPRRVARAAEPATSLIVAMRSSIYLRLFAATAFFGLSITSLVIHFVPMLVERGSSAKQAAAVASIIGITAIFGRLGTGFLLDRLRASLVGAVAFLLPIVGCALLLSGSQHAWVPALAAVSVGLTLGAEVDVFAYLTTRYFDLQRFGTLFGGLLTGVTGGTAVGPLVAAGIFDRFGGYTPFLWLVIAVMVLSSLCMVSLPPPPKR